MIGNAYGPWTRDHAEYLEKLIGRAIRDEACTEEPIIADVQSRVRLALIGLRKPCEADTIPAPPPERVEEFEDPVNECRHNIGKCPNCIDYEDMS